MWTTIDTVIMISKISDPWGFVFVTTVPLRAPLVANVYEPIVDRHLLFAPLPLIVRNSRHINIVVNIELCDC